MAEGTAVTELRHRAERVGASGEERSDVNIALGLIFVVVVVAVTSGVMLLVRRRAPEGSYFSDGDRASGVFGVLATGFSVLLAGFIIVLGFQAFDDARYRRRGSRRTRRGSRSKPLSSWAEPARSLLSGQAGLLRPYGRRSGMA